jgi:hypothetical protein
MCEGYGGVRINRRRDDLATIVTKLKRVLLTADCSEGMDELLSSLHLVYILAPVLQHNHIQWPKLLDTGLHDLTRSEAGCIGRALSKSITFRKSSDAAVNEWILKYPALRELVKEAEWFEPMMGVIALHLATSSRKGANLRLAAGVGISATDLKSDINMIGVYFSTPSLENFGWALLGMLLAGMLLGLVAAYLQNRKKSSKWEIAKECLIVVTGSMQGVAAYRVTQGKIQRKDELLDPKMVLMLTKSVEMFAEGSK